ncbi:uncharacterized protein V1518DRAFT_378192 [Limtongia smithiae]|uniref:uncharacterized protein n=1 Tax=Limtongia smithiae TaxID=1125753 RepID=UPI0034CEDF2C
MSDVAAEDDEDEELEEDEATSSPFKSVNASAATTTTTSTTTTTDAVVATHPAPHPAGTTILHMSARQRPRRRQPPHYREIRSRVQSISEKFLPILGDIALAKVGQLSVDQLSSKINNVYGELTLLRRFLEQDSPDDISLANNSIFMPVGVSAGEHAEDLNGEYHAPKRQKTSEESGSPGSEEMIRPSFAHVEQPRVAPVGATATPIILDDGARLTTVTVTANGNPNLPPTDADLHIPVVNTYRLLPHSSRSSYDTHVPLLNEKRREKLWAVMQGEIFGFAVGYNNRQLRTTEDFCALAYSQDGRMKRTVKNDLAISEALFDGISGFRKRLYQTVDVGAADGEDEEVAAAAAAAGEELHDCGIRAYTNNLYTLKVKPQNYYHYLFAAAFWRWVRDEIDSKTVTSGAAAASGRGFAAVFAVNSIEDWWRECVGICNGFVKTHPAKTDIKAFLKDRLLADEKKYPGA